MAIRDRIRTLAGRAGAAVRRFTASSPARLPGVGLLPTTPPAHNPKAAERIESEEGLTDWVGPGAGPSPDRIRSYPGDELSPADVQSIFREADKGFWLVRYADLWDDLRQRDYQIGNLDRGRRVAITTKKFQVHPSDPRDPIAIGLAKAVRAMVDNIDGFDASTYSKLSANGPGYSMEEPIYRYGTLRFTWDNATQSLYGLHPRELRWIHQRHAFFEWSTDAPHIDLGSDGRVPLSSTPHKLFFYRTVGDGISSTRGFERPVAWLHLLGQTSLVAGGIFMRRFGIPQIAAYIPQEKWKDEKFKAEVLSYLQAYGDGDPSIFPHWMKEMIKADPGPVGSGAMDLHMKWRGFIDASMAKSIQGAILQSEASGGGPGSYALGAVHEARSYDVSVCDAIGSCDHTRSTLFRAWIDLNQDALAAILNCKPEDLFARIPLCSRRIDRETTPKERAEIIALFAKGGLKASKSQLRGEYAIDEPVDDDDAFNGEPVAVAAGGAAVPAADAASKGVINPKTDEPAK